jgi:hypothetical protein
LDFDFDSDSSFSAQNLRPLRSRSSRWNICTSSRYMTISHEKKRSKHFFPKNFWKPSSHSQQFKSTDHASAQVWRHNVHRQGDQMRLTKNRPKFSTTHFRPK